MKVQVSCSGCGKTANVHETHLHGCTVRCTGCEKTFIAEATRDSDSPPPVRATSADKETHEPNEHMARPRWFRRRRETAGPSPDKVGRTDSETKRREQARLHRPL